MDHSPRGRDGQPLPDKAKGAVSRRASLLAAAILGAAVLYRLIGTELGAWATDSAPAHFLANLTGLQASYLLMTLGLGAGYAWGYPLGLIQLSDGGRVSSIAVSTACSGILSLGIFLVSFAVLAADFYGRVPRAKLAICLALGLGGTLLANVIRVSLISVVGYLWGPEPMYAFHTYAGYLTFLAFVTVFWYLSIRWLRSK